LARLATTTQIFLRRSSTSVTLAAATPLPVS